MKLAYENLPIVLNIIRSERKKNIFFSFLFIFSIYFMNMNLGTAICAHWSKSFARNMCQNHNITGQTNYAKCGWHSIIAGCWPPKCIANKFKLFSSKIISRLLYTIPFDAVTRFKQTIYT